jgi:hypothetical protein
VSANVPGYTSLSSDRLGSSVSSPAHDGSVSTACTTTSLPSGSTPAASQPSTIGILSAGSPMPRRLHTSWWLRAAARTVTGTQSGGGAVVGVGAVSRTSRAASGSEGEGRTATTATMAGVYQVEDRPAGTAGRSCRPAPQDVGGKSWSQPPCSTRYAIRPYPTWPGDTAVGGSEVGVPVGVAGEAGQQVDVGHAPPVADLAEGVVQQAQAAPQVVVRPAGQQRREDRRR